MMLVISILVVPAVVALSVQLLCYQQYKQASERKAGQLCGQTADQLC